MWLGLGRCANMFTKTNTDLESKYLHYSYITTIHNYGLKFFYLSHAKRKGIYSAFQPKPHSQASPAFFMR